MTSHEKIAYLLNKDWQCFVITFCGRSGSYFLHSALDGHKDILALPPWCSTIYSQFIDKKKNLQREKLHINSIGHLFEDAISYLSSLEQTSEAWGLKEPGASVPLAMLGRNKEIKYECNINILKENLHTIMSIAAKNNRVILRKDCFLSFFIAYGMTIGISLDEMMQKTTLLYQMHVLCVSQLKLLNEDFPKLKHLIAARNPVQSLLSHIQVNYAGRRSVYWHMAAIQTSFDCGIIQPFMNSQNTIALKVDLLNMYGEAYMKSVLSHLGMEWDDICAESTVNGQTFWWKKVNDKGTKIFTGFNSRDTDSICSIDSASCEEKLLLSNIFKERSDAWGYKTCPSEKIGSLGRLLCRDFECLKTIGLSDEVSHILSQGIWECYLNLMNRDVKYPITIPFEHTKDEHTCSM